MGIKKILLSLLNRSIKLYTIFLFSGTKGREDQSTKKPFDDIGEELPTFITGMMNLDQFIAFINSCNGMVSNGTGPLHVLLQEGMLLAFIRQYGLFIREMGTSWSKTQVFVLNTMVVK